MITMMKWILLAVFIFAAFATDKAIDFKEDILKLEATIKKLNTELSSAHKDYQNFEKESKKQIEELEDTKDWKKVLQNHGLQDLINKFAEEELNTPQDWKYVKPEDLKDMGFKVKHLVAWRKFYDQELNNPLGTVSYFEENNIKLQSEIEILRTKLTRAHDNYQKIEQENNEKIQEYEKQKQIEQKYQNLYRDLQTANEEVANSLLHPLIKDEQQKLNEYFIKEDKNKDTILHFAARKGHEETVKLLLSEYNKEEKTNLIEYITAENQKKETSLSLASRQGHDRILQLLLNEFSREYPEKSSEFLMKEEDENKNTYLHHASKEGYVKIVNVLFDALFAENTMEEFKKLFEYMMKKK